MNNSFFAYIIILSALFTKNTFAQVQINFDDSLQTTIGFNASYLHNSTAFTNEFLQHYYLGKYITDDVKNNVNQRLKSMNLLGMETNYNIYGIIHFDSVLHTTGHNLYVGLSSKSLFNLFFPDALFKMVFYGNKPYAGDTVGFSRIRATSFSYMSFDAGWIYQKNYSGLSITSGIVASFIKGRQYRDVGVANGFLYTEPNGTYIDFGAQVANIVSDTANPYFAGSGSSISFFTEIVATEKAKIHLQVSDVGFITWNSNTIEQRADTNFNFTGVEVANLFDNSSTNAFNVDSTLNNVFYYNEKQKITSVLPAALMVYYRQNINEKIQFTVGFNQRLFIYYNTYFFGDFNYRFTQKIASVCRLAYGGYGKLAIGVGGDFNVFKTWNIGCRFNNVEGLIMPKKTAGLSAQISIAKKIKK